MINIKDYVKEELEKYDGVCMPVRARLIERILIKKLPPSKLPNYYQIALHIDDEDIVVKNSRHYGFRVIQVSGQDPLWAEKILQEARRIRDLENNKKHNFFHH